MLTWQPREPLSFCLDIVFTLISLSENIFISYLPPRSYCNILKICWSDKIRFKGVACHQDKVYMCLLSWWPPHVVAAGLSNKQWTNEERTREERSNTVALSLETAQLGSSLETSSASTLHWLGWTDRWLIYFTWCWLTVRVLIIWIYPVFIRIIFVWSQFTNNCLSGLWL